MVVKFQKSFNIDGTIENLQYKEVAEPDADIFLPWEIEPYVIHNADITQFKSFCYVEIPESLFADFTNIKALAEARLNIEMLNVAEDFRKNCPDLFAKPHEMWKNQIYGI